MASEMLRLRFLSASTEWRSGRSSGGSPSPTSPSLVMLHKCQLRPTHLGEASAFEWPDKIYVLSWDARLDLLGTTAREASWERVPAAGTELRGRPPEIEFYFHLEISDSLVRRMDSLGSSVADGKLVIWGSLLGPSPGPPLPFQGILPASLIRLTPIEERLSIGGYETKIQTPLGGGPDMSATKRRWAWLRRG
jgi:hypothetical protein